MLNGITTTFMTYRNGQFYLKKEWLALDEEGKVTEPYLVCHLETVKMTKGRYFAYTFLHVGEVLPPQVGFVIPHDDYKRCSAKEGVLKGFDKVICSKT